MKITDDQLRSALRDDSWMQPSDGPALAGGQSAGRSQPGRRNRTAIIGVAITAIAVGAGAFFAVDQHSASRPHGVAASVSASPCTIGQLQATPAPASQSGSILASATILNTGAACAFAAAPGLDGVAGAVVKQLVAFDPSQGTIVLPAGTTTTLTASASAMCVGPYVHFDSVRFDLTNGPLGFAHPFAVAPGCNARLLGPTAAEAAPSPNVAAVASGDLTASLGPVSNQAPGAQFAVNLTVTNNGSAATSWPPCPSLQTNWTNGNGGVTTSMGTLPCNGPLASGATATYAISLTAPSVPGSYKLGLQLPGVLAGTALLVG